MFHPFGVVLSIVCVCVCMRGVLSRGDGLGTVCVYVGGGGKWELDGWELDVQQTPTKLSVLPLSHVSGN